MTKFAQCNDNYVFQIGNAVPPLMAKEIGREIKNCLEWKIQEEMKSHKNEEKEEIVIDTTTEDEEAQ